MNRYYDPAQPHHRPDGFQNNDTEFTPKSLAEVLRWRRDAARRGLPPPPKTPIPRVAPELAFLHANADAGAQMEPAVTWIGHATVLAQLGGLTLLTDPIFSERASPLSFIGPKRHQPPGVALDELPHVDLVLVSHNHYDATSSACASASPQGRRASKAAASTSPCCRSAPTSRAGSWRRSMSMSKKP